MMSRVTRERATAMKEHDLTLVGLTEDRSKLVLVSDAGEEFTLAADAKLLAALRGDHARLAQLEITMESALRPRDIQARIRAGETPESVAAAAQTSLDKVMGYATPVLAERAHIADRAQRASVRRKGGEGPARSLSDAVSERLRSRNVDPATVTWDAWRRDDGRWTLVADYRSGESSRHAEFFFDAPGQFVVAEDDEARWLVGETTTSHGPQPRQGTGPGRRLNAVRTDEELPLGEDAIELVSDPVDRSDKSPASVGTDPARPTADADWIATQASDRPHAPPENDPKNEAASEDGATSMPDPAEDEASPRSRKNRGRASVPSWDEIMFGGGKRE
ncbi:MAG: septation protein SepH [Nocardioides sp.]